jgi:hypothetical protein
MKELIFKVISGGQTGADTGGLKAAVKAGIKTGGAAPEGYLTEDGANPELGSVYGLYESTSDQYPIRTKENVFKSDGTLIFSKGNTPGSALTKKTCEKVGKPFLWLNPFANGNEKPISDFIRTVKAKNGRAIVLNIAGNRESKSSGIEKAVEEILYKVFSSK